MFGLERLRALDAVQRLGSVATAAAELHVTPSGVSQQLAKLERESGHRLTEPDGRGIRLTQAGLVLAGHAERVLDQLATAQRDLADLHTEILGPLRVGAVPSATRALVAPALAVLRERHPRLSPFLVVGEADDSMPGLQAGDIDIVVAESWDNRPIRLPADVAHVRVLTERALVALSERHPLAGRSTVAIAELAGTPWTSSVPGSGDHESLVQTLRAAGVEPEITCVVAEYPTQLALVAANVVAALIPPLGAPEPVPGVRLIPVDPPLTREIVAVWRADRERPAVRACLTALRDAAASTHQRPNDHPAPGRSITFSG